MNGRCDARPDLVGAPLPLSTRIFALRTSPELARRLFEPLGWQIETEEVPLAEGLGWGTAQHIGLTLTGEHRLADALSHLYVLLPALDGVKHYWVSRDEVDKLLRRGERWLAAHPERDLITRRYLVARDLSEDALARLDALDDAAPEAAAPEEIVPADDARPLRLDRRDAVLTVLREVGAHRVVDLGCGEGFYLRALLDDPTFTEILGVDVSARELERAEQRLARLPDRQRERIRLRQSSATYRDDELTGFDAMLLVEVIEHLDPDRLGALEANVFGHARPRHVVVTTPNAEYNARYEIPEGQFRHPDHRFEFTRGQFRQWAERIAGEYGYRVETRPAGPSDPELGSPTQLALLTLEVSHD